MDGHTAASIAREAARGQGTYFVALSGQMCWDAVAACQNDPVNFNSLAGGAIVDRETVINIPEGATIGFFRPGGALAHVMIGLGKGEAAGTKNGCVFSPTNSRLTVWETINLKDCWHDIELQRFTVRYIPF